MNNALITNIVNMIGDEVARDLKIRLWDSSQDYPHVSLCQVVDEWRTEHDCGLWYDLSETYNVANILRTATGDDQETDFADEMVAIQEMLIDNISADWQITENDDGERELEDVYVSFTMVC